MSRFRTQNAAHNWDHPRDIKGRFRPKVSQSIRVSARSASYNAGLRFPIVPGRLTLYTGALIRVERTSTAPGILSGAADGLIDKAVGAVGGGAGAVKVGAALKGDVVDIGGVKVQRSAIIQSPTVRLSKNSGGSDVRVRRARGQMKSTAATGEQQTPKAITAGPAHSTAKPRVRKARPARRGNTKAISGKKV